MQSIFAAMYALHPVLPAAWLVLFAQGLIIPAVYFWVKQMPSRIDLVWGKAKAGEVGARLVMASWLLTATACAFAVLLVLLR